MNEIQDPSHIAEMASRLRRLEQLAVASNESAQAWREPSPRRSGFREPRLDGAGGAPRGSVRRDRPGISPWLFVMATALNTMVAAVLAVIITLGVVRQERTDSEPRASVSTAALTAATQAVDLRPLGSPDQPLRFEAGKAAPLPLQIQPEDAAREPFILVLSGVPAGIVLSGAARIGSDTWFLLPGSANQLEITFPEWSASAFEVTIALRWTNGLVAAQSKAWIAVPPPAQSDTVTAKSDESAAKELLTKADRLLEKGDIVAARGLYQRAAEMGSALAALTLGATYDPNRLWSLGAFGMVGNKERAKLWYARASELGNADAKNRLKLLAN